MYPSYRMSGLPALGAYQEPNQQFYGLNALGIQDAQLHQRVMPLPRRAGLALSENMFGQRPEYQSNIYKPWPSDRSRGSSSIQLLQNAASHFDLDQRSGKIYLKKALEQPGLVVFYADWCGHCHKLVDVKAWQTTGQEKGVLFELEAMNGGRIPIFLVNVDEVSPMNGSQKVNTKLLQSLGIDAYPSIWIVNSDGSLRKKEYEGKRDIQSLNTLVSSF